MEKNTPNHTGMAGTLAATFINSRLTPLAIFAAIALGLGAIVLLPREEEPQIKVPMIDVYVAMPGASAREVEQRVTRPMEKLLWEIPGVEYLYSTSSPGNSLAIVRFAVGADLEESLVKLNQKLQTNFDRIPHGVSEPLVKPRTIDDVSILSFTLHSSTVDHYQLRRLAAEIDDHIKRLSGVAETTLIGGYRRQIRVQIDPLQLASRNLSASDILTALRSANRQSLAGRIHMANKEIVLETGHFLQSIEEVNHVVVGLHRGQAIYLREVAHVSDTSEEPLHYVLFGSGPAHSHSEHFSPSRRAAVTLSVAKRPGTNATTIARDAIAIVDKLKSSLIPKSVEVTITRNYGESAAQKSNELLLHMGIAVFGVAALILIFLGWRESIIVLLAIPSTLALTLLLFYLYGYTLNRITLFALIFSIGILVDDAIVVVENIQRHLHLPSSRGKSLSEIAISAVAEVGNPTILATWAVIAAILPMAFVGGLMGPYMRPIPVGASAAMFFSLLIAFIVTPWAAIRILLKTHPIPISPDEDPDHPEGETPNDFFTRLYHRFMDPMIHHVTWRWAFLGMIFLLLIGSISLFFTGWVKVKMLPFDNKSEFQVILDMPEGTPLETTSSVAMKIAERISHEPEVIHYQIYAGTASPFNFNGLVRHYFLRQNPYQADIQVNLLPKHERSTQSHDIAKRIRFDVAQIARDAGGVAVVAEVPPGPPVLQTLVAEIYGPNAEDRWKLAAAVKNIFLQTPGVVDVDWYYREDQKKVRAIVDEEKAALHGIAESTIAETIAMAVEGSSIDLLHQPQEKEDVNLFIEFPRHWRSHPEDLLALKMRSERNPQSPLVPLSELIEFEETLAEQDYYHKNLLPVVYVTGDVGGIAESPVYAIGVINEKISQLDMGDFGGTPGENITFYHLNHPTDTSKPAIKWDGEWHITLEVFRDLGIAFAAVLVLIYILMVGWFRSYVIPFVVMAAIPFSLIGILPAHGAMGAFFTATSMIGFMAGAGIVVRNSIILVDFIQLRLSHGLPLDRAVVEAGAVRFRPMLLTALAVVVGAAVILRDPIFQGLAIALMAGEIASLLISRMAVPILYFMVHRR